MATLYIGILGAQVDVHYEVSTIRLRSLGPALWPLSETCWDTLYVFLYSIVNFNSLFRFNQRFQPVKSKFLISESS